jgi:hypothetical protein
LDVRSTWHIEMESLRAEYKYFVKLDPDARGAIEKVHTVLSDTVSLPGSTPKPTGDSEVWARCGQQG